MFWLSWPLRFAPSVWLGASRRGISIYAGARQRSFGEALGLRGGAARAATAQGADGDRREH
ncbi:hypothetical protein MMEU_2657 [Mycobacterium marinum str. Europe]|nr:hypothetical protein MMEU_2657 [Mycobacterium marinum str. Europe]